MSDCIVVIPSYNPNNNLLDLLTDITFLTNYKIIIVNDGSTVNEYIFDHCKKYAIVLNHKSNLGKGSAIKTALSYIHSTITTPINIVIIDSDGQHKVNDMINIFNTLSNNLDSLILGSRCFKGKIPLRSKIGNITTSFIFKNATGLKIKDTQTGLRGFNSNLLPLFMSVKGNRYEYEMNILLECAKNKIRIIEVPIETIYIDDNKSSHFNPIKDSILIYKTIIKFVCSFVYTKINSLPKKRDSQ